MNHKAITITAAIICILITIAFVLMHKPYKRTTINLQPVFAPTEIIEQKI